MVGLAASNDALVSVLPLPSVLQYLHAFKDADLHAPQIVTLPP